MTTFAWWIDALSSITRLHSISTPSLSLIKEISSFMNFWIKFDLTLPFTFPIITPPVYFMAVTNDHEFLKQMLLTILSFPFGIQVSSFFCKPREPRFINIYQHDKLLDNLSELDREQLLGSWFPCFIKIHNTWQSLFIALVEHL